MSTKRTLVVATNRSKYVSLQFSKISSITNSLILSSLNPWHIVTNDTRCMLLCNTLVLVTKTTFNVIIRL